MHASVITEPFEIESVVPTDLPKDEGTSSLLGLTLVAITLLLVWAGFRVLLPDSQATFNLWMPLSVAACCLWGILHLVRGNALWMWSPLVSLLAAFAVFHGLGPLLHVLGNAAAIAYANQFARIDQEDLAATNLLNLVSLTVTLLSFTLVFYLRTRIAARWQSHPLKTSSKSVSLLAWGMIGLSLPLKYFVVLPYFLGWSDPAFVLPGFVVVLGNLSFLCLFLLFYHGWTRNALFYIPAGALFLLEIATGLVSFNKSEVIMTLGVCFLGLYLAKPSKYLASGAVTLIVVVYFLITPVVSRGRGYLRTNPASISDRLEALNAAWQGDGEESSSNVQGWWTRLCYANAQAFAMRQYDTGITGDSFKLILPAIVPRMLWPDKPIMTPGYDFNRLATGNPRSSSAPGVFAEAYWNDGWAGVVLVCSYLGLLLGWFTHIAFCNVTRHDLRWLPFGIGGLMMGASITDWFASTYVGGVLTIALYLALVKIAMPAPIDDRRLTGIV